MQYGRFRKESAHRALVLLTATIIAIAGCGRQAPEESTGEGAGAKPGAETAAGDTGSKPGVATPEAETPLLTAAFDAEFITRPDGYGAIKQVYGFEFKEEPKQMDPGLMYKACADEAVDVIDAFATDGRIPAYDLKVIDDDKNVFPPYYAAPLVRSKALDEHPKLKETLNKLAGRLTDRRMQRLNFEVDEKGRKAEDVAREWLVAEELVAQDAKSGSGEAGTVTIGSKHFTEQQILGEIMSILIETTTDIKVNRKLNLGGTMICFNALKADDLDLYAEYTGTGLVNILQRKVITDPEEVYRVVSEQFKKKYDLVWLKPFGINNTYTLTMRAKQAQELGIDSISDLAKYVNSNNP